MSRRLPSFHSSDSTTNAIRDRHAGPFSLGSSLWESVQHGMFLKA